MKKIAFIIPPTVEILDLAGPLQVFTEAKFYGFDLQLEFYTYTDEPVSNSGLGFDKVADYRTANLNEGDYIFVPGMSFDYVDSIAFRAEKDFFNWLKEQSVKKVFLCSVCNGAFALGEAGLLQDTECTTHWRRIDALKARFPKAKVLTDVLFKKSNNVYTSAGISSGIDLALSILEELKGAFFTHKVARGLVVYYRRNDSHTQKSIYLDYRNHIHPKIHEVQDYMINNLSAANTIEELADMVAMSPRNLSRVFKEKTGTTIIEYLTLLRIEFARTLVNNPEYTIEYIAAQCGFKSARQLQRILKNKA
ncbi:AraC family transcriptional regulator [Flavobacterium silvisoli]|uniref:AraC family transcriptional regulator n=1 Tax=Flavobacterium silvisoli TaxID=2529433 RepID=A0A4Q9Z2B5_9FLAO|nr:helix-turn-helix domain-containing protein [Flavobacterium silvisoli]TBX70312.1 AraC family transcriptional regulator [Flavobacterium silvisoli]